LQRIRLSLRQTAFAVPAAALVLALRLALAPWTG
jgi:hypothetical protein